MPILCWQIHIQKVLTMDILMKAAKSSDTRKDRLYHLTTQNKIPSILYKGLLPGLGSNSGKIDEHEEGIYLCDIRDVKYWQILLDCDTLIEVVGIKPEDCEKRPYSSYSEYIYKDSIPPRMVHRVKMPRQSNEAMRELCLSYMASMSYACVASARYYNYLQDDEDKEEYRYSMLAYLDMVLAVIDKLDYRVLTEGEKEKWLIEYGEDGAYTFLDTYLNTDTKLYQELICYPDDEFTEKRTQLYEFIKETFKQQLHLNTGGWTG